jgi:hypothetical protein
MTRYNILWGLLHGGSDTETDWMRGSSEKPGLLGRDADVFRLLPEKDDAIRGWLTETFVRSALSSSWGREILRLDKANTYKKELTPPETRLFTTRSNIPWPVTWYNRPKYVVLTRAPSDDDTRYSRTTTYKPVPDPASGVDELITDELSFSYTSSEGVTQVITVDIVNGKTTLPFDDGELEVRGLTWDYISGNILNITYKALPKWSPSEKLKERLGTDDFPEAAGEFCVGLLRRHP